MSSHIFDPIRATARYLTRLARAPKARRAPAVTRVQSAGFVKAYRAKRCRCGIDLPDENWICSEGCFNARD